MERRRYREILLRFAESDYNVITLFQPLCRELTEKVILFQSYDTPRPGVSNYTVKGKDITDLVESLIAHSFEIPGQADLGLGVKIEQLPVYTYCFSGDYSFELIRK